MFDRPHARFSQSSVCTLLGLFVLVSACDSPKLRKLPSSPPIIVVNIDTLRADHLGCYGYGRDTSPNIDRFAEEAALFTWTFSQAPNTPPSQASILTGLYPSSHGRIRNKHVVSSEAVTLAEVLAKADYRTAAFVDGGLMAEGFGLEQGFEIYDDRAGGVAAIGPRGLDWIDSHLADPEKREDPFLLLLHTYDVHSPYENTPEPFRDRYLGELEQLPSEAFQADLSGHMEIPWKARNNDPEQLDAAELAYAIAMYDGGIRHVDDWFGRFVKELKKRGLFESSIIVVISDHGDSFQEHGQLFHSEVYASVTRVPLLIRFPRGRFAGRYDSITETIDLMPTLLHAVALRTPEEVQGQSLLPVLRGRESKPKFAYSETPLDGNRIAVTAPRYRLIYTNKTGESELYAFRKDRAEQNDLSSEQPELDQRLEAAVRRWKRKVREFRFEQKEVESISPETEEQLRALGYID